jgi:hypothetical protein
VALSAADAKDTSKPALTPQGRITVGADEIMIAGDGLDKLRGSLQENRTQVQVVRRQEVSDAQRAGGCPCYVDSDRTDIAV